MSKLVITLCLAVMSFTSNSQLPKWKITDVENYIKTKKDQVLVINFWATFCKPCIAEIPFFIRITNQYKKDKVKLLLVSLDLPSYYPKKIAAFAKKQKFTADITWLNETNADYFCPRVDSSWSGSIPATLIVNTKTGYRKFMEEEMEAADFERELKKAIGE